MRRFSASDGGTFSDLDLNSCMGNPEIKNLSQAFTSGSEIVVDDASKLPAFTVSHMLLNLLHIRTKMALLSPLSTDQSRMLPLFEAEIARRQSA